MGMRERRKGRRGETTAKRLLADHDYAIIADTASGIATDDLVVQDEAGCVWSVEVKTRKSIEPALFCGQARKQAGKKRWMLLAHIDNTSSWLVLRKGMRPTVWHQKEESK